MAQQYTQAHLDAMARQLGFRDWMTYAAWQNKQWEMLHGPLPQGAQEQGGAQSSSPSWNEPGGAQALNDTLGGALSWHPGVILDYVQQKLGKALGGGQ